MLFRMISDATAHIVLHEQRMGSVVHGRNEWPENRMMPHPRRKSNAATTTRGIGRSAMLRAAQNSV
jgi:hypothetical protein